MKPYKSRTGMFLIVKKIVISLAIVMLISLTSCSPGGSGTGVGNGTVLIGKVMNADSLPVEKAIVRLRTDRYLADTSGHVNNFRNDTLATTFTDHHGFFTIDSLQHSRIYCIEILDTSSGLDSGTFYRVDLSSHTVSDTIRLPDRVIRPVKDIKGTIVLNGLPRNAYVQFYGIERLGRVDSNGVFIIEHLPPPSECEKNECEYKLKITVIMRDNSVKVYESELEVRFDTNENIIAVEFELEDD